MYYIGMAKDVAKMLTATGRLWRESENPNTDKAINEIAETIHHLHTTCVSSQIRGGRYQPNSEEAHYTAETASIHVTLQGDSVFVYLCVGNSGYSYSHREGPFAARGENYV